MAKVGFSYDDRELRRNVSEFRTNLRRNIAAVVDYNAGYAQAWMREKAPWTDQTGAARSGLFAIPLEYGNTFEIFMAYSVHYGIWLEVANNRKYAILTPVMRIIGDKLIKDMQHLIDRMGKL